MSILEVKVPDIGDFKDVPVIEIIVSPGDTVKAEDALITLESDKATLEVPSPAAGVVKEIKLKIGDKVAEGTLVLLLETGAVAAAAEIPPGPPLQRGEPAASPAPPPFAKGGPGGISPPPQIPRRFAPPPFPKGVMPTAVPRSGKPRRTRRSRRRSSRPSDH